MYFTRDAETLKIIGSICSYKTSRTRKLKNSKKVTINGFPDSTPPLCRSRGNHHICVARSSRSGYSTRLLPGRCIPPSLCSKLDLGSTDWSLMCNKYPGHNNLSLGRNSQRTKYYFPSLKQ